MASLLPVELTAHGATRTKPTRHGPGHGPFIWNCAVPGRFSRKCHALGVSGSCEPQAPVSSSLLMVAHQTAPVARCRMQVAGCRFQVAIFLPTITPSDRGEAESTQTRQERTRTPCAASAMYAPMIRIPSVSWALARPSLHLDFSRIPWPGNGLVSGGPRAGSVT